MALPGGGKLDKGFACERIWRQLGCEVGGHIDIAGIVKHSRYLERTFPELLRRHAEVAERGKVSWEAFRTLYLSPPAPKINIIAPPAPAVAPARGVAAEEAQQRRAPRELRAIFDEIDADHSGTIRLQDVIEKQDFVGQEIPEVLAKWSEIDTDDSGSISWAEFRAFFGDADDWLEWQLGEIIGLEALKTQIRRFHRGVLLDKLRGERGSKVKAGGKFHMIFQGNPGTGKTSMARIMAQLLKEVGISPGDKLTEVQQESLVAGYVGQTAPKTQKVVEEAVGGILFIDEAYRLSQGGEKNYGKEAIEQLMAAMNEPPEKAPIMVFAGYPADMDKFMTQNDGLYRRIPYTFDFPNYSCAELAEILEAMVTSAGFRLERSLLDNGRQLLTSLIEANTLPRSRALMNGGLCERIFTFAKQALDARDDLASPSLVVSVQDITSACQQIPPPPGPAPEADGPAAAPGAASEQSQELLTHVERLQGELLASRQENERLQRAAAQGSDEAMVKTLRPEAAQTLLGATMMAEGRGLRELLREVRRLKAEASEREDAFEELQRENEGFRDTIRRLEAAASSGGLRGPLAVVTGTKVQYLSASLNKWIDAVVEQWDDVRGAYNLDVKKNVPPDRVRKREEADA